MITTQEMTLEEKLEAIAQAMEQADGNVERENQLLSSIVDPQDALNCEGCQ